MQLSNDLLSQFAKVTNDKKEPKKETTVYGTVTAIDGQKYVMIDGSELATPCDTTTSVEVGERVAVQIKNHTATITGNMSSPAVRVGTVEDINGQVSIYIDKVEAYKASIEDLDAKYAQIEHLHADYAEVDKLEAAEAEIGNLKAATADIDTLRAGYATITELEADFGDFKTLTVDQLASEYAFIKELDAKEIDTDSLNAKYANIDFSNIEEAAIQKLFTESGIIENLVMEDGHVTGKLVGVTINGDMIEGNTIKADKLLVQGNDGLYYKLNVNALGEANVEKLPSEEQDALKNGLHGSIIVAKSITTDQIYVSDLVAFGATIGGFTISQDEFDDDGNKTAIGSIHSNAKGTVNATTPGIYLDNEGQMAIGNNADNYIKYYKQSDGTYKLEIEADSILLKTAEKHVNIGDYESRISTAETVIEQNKKDITLKASETYVNNAVDGVKIGGRNLVRDSAMTKDTDFWSFSSTDCSYTFVNGYCEIYRTNLTSGRSFHLQSSNVNPLLKRDDIAGSTFTLSAEIKLLDGHEPSNSNTLFYRCNTTDLQAGFQEMAIKLGSATNEWQKVSTTFTFGNYNFNGTAQLTLAIANIMNTGFCIRNIKLEKGNKATDWSPAPEDYFTKEQTTAEINVAASNIRLKVSETYATKQSLEDLEIGAANLILNSNFASGIDKWYISASITADVEQDETHGSCLKFTSTVSGSTSSLISSDPYDNFIHTEGTYSLSFYAKTDAGTTATLRSNVAGSSNCAKEYSLTSSWKRCTHTYTCDTNTGYMTFWLNEAGATAYITKIQVEHGDKVTDWGPAPSELSTTKDIDDVRGSVDDVRTDVNTATSEINILKNKLEFLATDGVNQSLLVQNGDSWVFNLGSITDSINDVSKDLDDVKKINDQNSADVESLQSTVESMGELTEKIKVGRYVYVDDEGIEHDDSSIELYETDSEFKHVITNTQSMYLDGSNVVSTTNHWGQTVENMKVRNEFQQGKFVWKSRTNGNYGLMWKG